MIEGIEGHTISVVYYQTPEEQVHVFLVRQPGEEQWYRPSKGLFNQDGLITGGGTPEYNVSDS